MIIFYIILLLLLAYTIYEQQQKLEQQQQENEKLKENIIEIKKHNDDLYSSLIQSEKATQKAEICAKGHEITINALKRELEVKTQLLKQLDRKNGNE